MTEATTKGSANMSASPMNLSVFKEHACAQLMSLLDSVEGPKVLVIDAKLSGPIGLIADAKSLKEHGVERIVYLEPGRMSAEQPNLVYLVSPQVEHMQTIAEHVRWMKGKGGGGNKRFYVYFVSRMTMICERALEQANISGIHTGEFQLDLIPFDDDVLSLEQESAYRECVLEKNPKSLFYVARSLMKLQSIFGVIGNIKGKGNSARLVADMMLRMRRELDTDEEAKVPEIDTLILIDREVDMVTPMCTQLTYEGLIDEFFHIKHGAVPMKGSVVRKEPADDTFLQPLNSNDAIFNDIRNFNYGVLRKFITTRGEEIDQYYKKRHEQQTLGQIREYVKKLSSYQAEHQSLLIHTSIAQLIAKEMKSAGFRRKLDAEQDLLSGHASAFPYIEECINKQEPILKVLRLLVLQSLTNNGLKPKAFAFFRRELLQTYGNELFVTLCHLERLGLLVQQERNTYAHLRKTLRTVVKEVDLAQPEDIAYVYSGYAPLSVRIVEATAKPATWRALEEPLSHLPGPQFEEHQEIPEGIKQLSADRAQGTRNKVALVFFIGGITYAEISAIRYLHTLENGTRDFIIATTGFINGGSLLNTIIDPIGNLAKKK